jgi:UDP-glucuronate 4-epimerase
VPQTFADISKARKLLGYDPQTEIEIGIRRFVEWLRANQQAPEKTQLESSTPSPFGRGLG